MDREKEYDMWMDTSMHIPNNAIVINLNIKVLVGLHYVSL